MYLMYKKGIYILHINICKLIMEERQSDWQRRIFAEVNVAIWHISKTGTNKMCNKVILVNKGYSIIYHC